MAAPAEMKGYKNNAKWIMNTKLSDESDSILAAQGVGYLKRKAIGMTTVAVTNTSKVENGVLILTSASTASGLPGAVEVIHLDGSSQKSDHSIYGKIISTAMPKAPSDISEPYLTNGMLEDSKDEEGRIFQVASKSDKEAGNKYTWEAVLTSGYQNVEVNGKLEKRFCRMNHFKDNKGFEKKIRLVYDYVGPV